MLNATVHSSSDGIVEKSNWLWIPYVSMTVLMLIFLIGSFINYHIKNRDKYRRNVSRPVHHQRASDSLQMCTFLHRIDSQQCRTALSDIYGNPTGKKHLFISPSVTQTQDNHVVKLLKNDPCSLSHDGIKSHEDEVTWSSREMSNQKCAKMKRPGSLQTCSKKVKLDGIQERFTNNMHTYFMRDECRHDGGFNHAGPSPVSQQNSFSAKFKDMKSSNHVELLTIRKIHSANEIEPPQVRISRADGSPTSGHRVHFLH